MRMLLKKILDVIYYIGSLNFLKFYKFSNIIIMLYLVLVAPNSISMASSIIVFAFFSFLDEVEGLPTFETEGRDGGGVQVELKRQINIPR